MTYVPDFVHYETNQQCLLNRFDFNITINKVPFRNIYLLDTTQNEFLKSTKHYSKLPSNEFRNQLPNKFLNSYANQHILYLCSLNVGTALENDKVLHFLIFIHQRKF